MITETAFIKNDLKYSKKLYIIIMWYDLMCNIIIIFK